MPSCFVSALVSFPDMCIEIELSVTRSSLGILERRVYLSDGDDCVLVWFYIMTFSCLVRSDKVLKENLMFHGLFKFF